MPDKIKTPRGQIIKVTTPNGRIEAQLTWNPNFAPKTNRQYTLAQKFVDSEILRLSEPYTPFQTGILKMSGTLGTVVGSGLVRYIAPYAQKRYYTPSVIGNATGKLRGFMWFERMKTDHGRKIVDGAKKIAGGG